MTTVIRPSGTHPESSNARKFCIRIDLISIQTRFHSPSAIPPQYDSAESSPAQCGSFAASGRGRPIPKYAHIIPPGPAVDSRGRHLGRQDVEFRLGSIPKVPLNWWAVEDSNL
jgi:hypothetical protein